jgi:transcriptional regulator with XRE-family HTH domain
MHVLREAANLTQSQVAAFTGIPLEEIAEIECGEKLPTIDDACVIAIWLDVPVYEVFDWHLVRYQRNSV